MRSRGLTVQLCTQFPSRSSTAAGPTILQIFPHDLSSTSQTSPFTRIPVSLLGQKLPQNRYFTDFCIVIVPKCKKGKKFMHNFVKVALTSVPSISPSLCGIYFLFCTSHHVFFHGDVSRVNMENPHSPRQMFSRVPRLAKSMLEQ